MLLDGLGDFILIANCYTSYAIILIVQLQVYDCTVGAVAKQPATA